MVFGFVAVILVCHHCQCDRSCVYVFGIVIEYGSCDDNDDGGGGMGIEAMYMVR